MLLADGFDVEKGGGAEAQGGGVLGELDFGHPNIGLFERGHDVLFEELPSFVS